MEATSSRLGFPVSDPVVLIALAVALLLCVLNYEALNWMFISWTTKEEYSHGIMIPAVSCYLAWQRREQLIFPAQGGVILGLSLVIAGLVLYIVSSLATVYVAMILAFLVQLYGLFLVSLGSKNFRTLMAPLLMLVFMVPLPTFINNNLSAELQLISSWLGVEFIRLFGIGVYLEGNVIDLGSYKLQVVDACSGLRYLYPLVSLGFILAYLCDVKLWMRTLVFLSTIPITVIMNSIRIGAIGVSVEYWGPEMAEGLLHDIEGWFMFMASLAVVLLELFLLLKLTGDRRSLSDIIDIGRQTSVAASTVSEGKGLEKRGAARLVSVVSLLVLVSGSLVYSTSSIQRESLIPERLNFNHFPLLINGWRGTPQTMDQQYIDVLRFDDYMIADYIKHSERVNFYVAYYGSQESGQSAHSPRSCIPGGGWQIHSIEQIHLGEMYLNSQPLMANRVLIQKGDHKQAVYYWFQQRGRIITNEYLVKWYLFWDALTLNRTDGALVRLTVPLGRDQGFEQADRIVSEFMHDVQFRLDQFIPGQTLVQP